MYGILLHSFGEIALQRIKYQIGSDLQGSVRSSIKPPHDPNSTQNSSTPSSGSILSIMENSFSPQESHVTIVL